MLILTARVLSTILLLPMLVASASRAAEVVEAARMQNSADVTAIPTPSGWMAPSPNRITVLTPDQNAIYDRKVKRNERFIHSERGDHFGVLKYNDHSPTTFSLLRLEVFDNTGELVWSTEKPQAISFVLSDGSPRAVGIVGAEGLAASELQLYSNTGELRNSLMVSHLFGIRFSSGGEYLFVNSADSGLIAYDTSGSPIFNYGLTKKFCVSEDGRYVASTNSSGISYFKDGVKIKSLALGSDSSAPVVAMQFDPDLRFLALLRQDRLSVYRIPVLEPMGEEVDQSGNHRFTSLDCSAGGLLAVGYDIPSKENGRKIHTKGGVTLFDSAGAPLWTLELSYSDWTREFPMVCFTRDGRSLQIATADEARLFTISP